MNKIFFLLAAISLLFCTACKEKIITLADNGRTIHLEQNQVLTVELPGRSGSDSCWRRADFDNSILLGTGSGNYVLSERKYLLNEGGEFHFRFLAINPGITRLYMEYGDKNDPEEPPAKTFEIKIIIKKGKE